MMKWFSSLRQRIFPDQQDTLSPEQLRENFARRYELFRSLLTANNNALQAMADLEKIYYSGDSYRMTLVRSQVTTILVNVYKMVRNLRAMSDNRYAELEKIFNSISAELEEILERKPPPIEGPLVIGLHNCRRRDRHLTGEKMANLGEATTVATSFTDTGVPPGFVITAAASRELFTPELVAEINRRLQLIDQDDLSGLYRTSTAIHELILEAVVPPALESLIVHHFDELAADDSRDLQVALRSSAQGEDGQQLSFAGLYRSVLNVNRDGLLQAWKEVLASKYGARAIAYRRRRGFRHEDIEMCVGCMLMIEGRVSGVMYSEDPENPEDGLIRINATSGGAKGVVDGTAATSLYLLQRSSLQVTSFTDAGPSANNASLLETDDLQRLANLALKLEKHFNCPQDIEWSLDHAGRLWLLQSRPLLHQSQDLQDESRKSASNRVNNTSAGHTPVQSVQPENIVQPLLSGGICAARGVACGTICRVETDEQLVHFTKGSILLVSHPLPDWAVLLNRCSAVIAEHGSEAGHLATICREYGLPALFSLPKAKALLEEGQLVTVDAAERCVYAGRQEEVLRRKTVKRDMMAGSRVQRLVTEALQRITPLNLNDPSSPRFKSSWCETLHDITRFCHEKSVTEMFKLGEAQQFSKSGLAQLLGAAQAHGHSFAGAKGLSTNCRRICAEMPGSSSSRPVPLEWWVIDLADGFHDHIATDSATVSIGEIASRPMLAIWRGIAAYPWQGPPPVSMRGFGSIIFQSAMRPELDPAVPSSMTTRNYFLIARNFCNLSVRLGYHYAMIEAYIGELLTENYVTFRFKGGAADQQRKAVRAKLLADICCHYGFRVELRSDALLARLKKQPAEYLEQRLQMLGYLSLHARQLDMVMNQPQAVEQYRQKFMEEIEKMVPDLATATSEAAQAAQVAHAEQADQRDQADIS